MSIELSRIASLLEALVKIPSYYVEGIALDQLVLTSNRSGVRSIWAMDLGSRELREIVKGPIAGMASPNPSSPYIVYARDITRGRELHRLYIYNLERGDTLEFPDIEPMRVISIGFNGEYLAFSGSTMETMSIYYGRVDGRCEKLVDLDKIVAVIDANDRYVVGFGHLRGDPRSYELYIYDLETSEAKIYTPREGSSNTGPMIYSSDKILFRSDYTGEQKLYFYDVETGEIEEVKYTYDDLVKYRPVEIINYRWDEEGRIWVIATRNGRAKLFLDGREIPTPEGMISGATVHRGKAYFAHSSLVSPHKVYSVDLETGDRELLIDNKLPEDIAEKMGDREHVFYRSHDGLEVPMYIVYSRKTEKPGPSVVYIHGGPWSLVSDSWRLTIAALVASGYHVLAPNFRGSTGYGDEFRKLDIGDPGGGDLWDVVYALKYGVDKKIVDPGRVAIMGYSYGGYMTLLAMGKHPELWKCGVAGASVVDWEEMYGLSDAVFKKFIEVLFDGKRELFRERSPITYADNIKAPLCIVHPQNDTRTPLKPVLKLMNKLLEHGKTFEAHITPDMGHVINTIDDAVKILLPALIFLKKHLQ